MNSNGQGLGDSEELKNVSSAAEPTQVQSNQQAADTDTPPASVEVEAVEMEMSPASAEVEAEPVEAAAPAEPEAGTPSAEGDWLAQDTSDLKQLKKGDILEGTVTATSPTAVYVDVGAKTEGVIPARELERRAQAGVFRMGGAGDRWAARRAPRARSGVRPRLRETAGMSGASCMLSRYCEYAGE